MSDFEIINIPKHILYKGNLYELVDTNIVSVTDITFDAIKIDTERLKAKLKEVEDE